MIGVHAHMTTVIELLVIIMVMGKVLVWYISDCFIEIEMSLCEWCSVIGQQTLIDLSWGRGRWN